MDKKAAEELHTSLTAGRVLAAGAQRISASLDSFSGWLLAGFGALFGLVFANLDSLAAYMYVSRLRWGAAFFLLAATLAACQKLLAAYVLAGTAAGEDGRNVGKELATSDLPLNVESMYAQVNKGLFWPWRQINAHMTAKAKAGDYAVTGRVLAQISQIQSYLVAAQAALSIVSAAFVVSAAVS